MLEKISDTFNKILSVFSTFGISDALDIILVAIIIYICVRIIRESRAMQLAKGFIFIAIIYGIVTLLDMEASSFIFKAIFSNILIILVILFGPEIRNILEQVGKGATSILQAKASRELVENIFYPKSPLHDGAMVIRDGKIYAAGCILPLTKKLVSSSLGTRHRAGIGLTEESDALVVIVSEETGAISVAKGGILQKDVSYGDLRDILTTQFIPSGSSDDDKIINKLVRRIKK